MANLSKLEVLDAFKTLLQEKIDEAEIALKDIVTSRDSESKSSAGDKYETGRAMAQIAQQQTEAQLSQVIKQYQQIALINADKRSSSIEFGSLVQTNHNCFFISIGIGSINIKGMQVYGMSITSPLGIALKGKSEGDSLDFNGKSYEILEVL